MATASFLHVSEDKSCCPICLGDFKLPRQLWCMHTFCQGCLQDFINSKVAQGKELTEFSCPICRNVTRPSDKDKPTSVWATLFPLNTVLQAISGNATAKVDQPCEACNTRGVSSQGVGFCVDCKEVMCETCEGVHRGLKLSRNHIIITMEEFMNNPQTVMKFAEGFNCSEHAGKEIEFYCKDHKIACCGTCCIVRHRNCCNVSELKKELSSLLRVMHPDSIIEQMKTLEAHLKKFKQINESNISLLESQVNNLTTQIRQLRKKLNDALDELETKVKTEGNRIYKEEMMRKQKENHECETIISAIRNSHTHIEAAKKYGTDTQLFLTVEKMTSQVTSYRDHIREKYQKTDILTLQLEFDPQMLSLSQSGSEMLSWCVEKKLEKFLNCPDIIMPMREYSETAIKLKLPCIKEPFYNGVQCLPNSQFIITDSINESVYLMDSSYNLVTSYASNKGVRDICLVNGNEVALLQKNNIQFLSVRDGKIIPTRMIATRGHYYCGGIVVSRNGDIFVSGRDDDYFYWSQISLEGRDMSYHQFGKKTGTLNTNIALDSSDSRVYVSVCGLNTLFGFSLDGSQNFAYSSESLKGPRGVAVDIDDNVYIVGQDSKNIHQLSPSGCCLRIISTDLHNKPVSISFLTDYGRFYITGWNSKRLGIFKLQ
ncbi:hypothetical protein CHS0354_015364 [Potamilus streckersoni]|uniref:Uncharacterized protein n=1 Tax=Potamilus streckersoni TaxID=2493646 RepID=A0AAE0TBM7_9BIVA|nr:hypothetical protein CHS0354_015364 [Potamilus streckersoni]